MTTKQPSKAAVIECIQKQGPATIAEVAQRTNSEASAARRIILLMRANKELHISSYKWVIRKYAMVLSVGASQKREPTIPEKMPATAKAIARKKAQILRRARWQKQKVKNAAERAARPDRPKVVRVRTDRLVPRRKLTIPSYALQSVFVGGVNPWIQEKTA